MFVATLTICCITACMVDAFPIFQRPYYHERTTYVTDDRGYGNKGYRNYDEGGNRQRQESHSSHGSSDYEDGESHSIRDRIKKNKHDQGSKSSVYNSGGKEEHAKKSHDKTFYEKEKKYGFEKSYGYERETKSHDKASNSHSHSSGYNHKDDKAQHNIGEQFLRDLINDGKKYKRGYQSHGSKSGLFDSSSHHNIGKEFEAELTGDNQFFKRSGPISNFAPNFIPKEYMFGIDHAMTKFKYLRGIHGLGGLRANALNFGYNPLRYKYMNPDMKSEILELNPLFLDVEHPHSKVFYSQS